MYKEGDKVLIKYSGERCYGDIGDTPIEATIIGYHTDFIDEDMKMRKGAYKSYNTFKDEKGQIFSFCSDIHEKYIIKLLEPTYEIY